MLDLESTIKHCEEMTEKEKNEEMCRVEELMGLELQNAEMMKYAREHKQLAEWLKELKQFKEQQPCEDCISRQVVLETIDNRIEQIKRDANEINKSYSHLSFAEGIHDGYCRLKCDLRILSSVKPQEPCGKDINVPATDAISRQMAIDALGECPMNWTDSDDEITAERDWEDTVEMLKSLPSVTPQPKMGRWIEIAKYSDGRHEIECSECGSHIFDRGHANSYVVKEKYKYCPRCGAKMVEPQERSDKE